MSESTVFLVLQDVQVGDPCIGLDQGKHGRAGVGEETGYHRYKLCHIPYTDTELCTDKMTFSKKKNYTGC